MDRASVTPNRVLTAQARESLKGRWGLAACSFLVMILVTGAIQIVPFIGGLLSFFISGPLALGWAIFALSVARNEPARLQMIFDGFQRFGSALAAYLLVGIFVVLWSLLLIVPGIIAALAYSQVFYILADNRTEGPLEAIRKSKRMMKGNKGKLFCLGLRFLGWAMLCILTFGIGFFWFFPYIAVTGAKFYDGIHEKEPVGQEAVTGAFRNFE